MTTHYSRLAARSSQSNPSGVWGRLKNAYELLNLTALKISMLYKNHIFQCMGKIFCVEFQKVPLKFHTRYLTHTLKDVDFIHRWKFKSSYIYELISVFEHALAYMQPRLKRPKRLKNDPVTLLVTFRIPRYATHDHQYVTGTICRSDPIKSSYQKCHVITCMLWKF